MAELNEKMKDNKDQVAIKVENVSKTFKVPHEKNTSLKSSAINLFGKKGYEIFKALDDISFEVKKGEFFGIIGRNGSGKSTLLKILAGIYVPDKKSGTLTINGKLSPFLELGVGFNPELSGRENVFLGGTILGLSRGEVAEKFDKIVNFAELEEFIDMKFKNYSSGMQVRLAFALAINARAEILLMDEVLAVGDNNFQEKCINEFNKYKKEGKTVVLVSHDIFTIQKYCDRTIWLKNGKIAEVGPSKIIGNKYLEESALEQEKWLFEVAEVEKNEIKDATQRNGRVVVGKKAKIVSVRTLSPAGKEKKIFSPGEKIVIEVAYKVREKIENPILGVTIYDTTNKIPIFVTNTLAKKVTTGTINPGKLVMTIEIDNKFADGEFRISPAMANDNAKYYFDWLDDAAQFYIKNNINKSGGLVDFEHTLEVK